MKILSLSKHRVSCFLCQYCVNASICIELSGKTDKNIVETGLGGMG